MTVLIAVLGYASDAAARVPSETVSPDTTEVEPLGINLEGVRYPVQYFDFGSDRGVEAPKRPGRVGPLHMAYMDVRPATPSSFYTARTSTETTGTGQPSYRRCTRLSAYSSEAFLLRSDSFPPGRLNVDELSESHSARAYTSDTPRAATEKDSYRASPDYF